MEDYFSIFHFEVVAGFVGNAGEEHYGGFVAVHCGIFGYYCTGIYCCCVEEVSAVEGEG